MVHRMTEPASFASGPRAPLSAIQNIEFDVSFVESLLGYGDVIITTAGGAGKGQGIITGHQR